MKNLMILGLLASFASANYAMEAAKNAAKLTFTKAQPGEDLTAYKEILLKVYPEFVEPKFKEPIKEALVVRFATLAGWVGKKGKVFVKIEDQGKPVGFTTFEALDEDNTQIAFHHSPLLPEYIGQFQKHFDSVKTEFPHAQVVFTSVSDKAPKLQAIIRSIGFVEDASYVANKEIVPNPEGFQGYKKSLEK